jgi:hypothetical protein
MNEHATNLFIGKPKSGKTSLVWSLFKSKDLSIIIFQPKPLSQSLKIYTREITKHEQRFYELNSTTIAQAENIISSHNEEEPKHRKSCVIIDDFATALKNKENEEA